MLMCELRTVVQERGRQRWQEGLWDFKEKGREIL